MNVPRIPVHLLQPETVSWSLGQLCAVTLKAAKPLMV
jgi:hypothetical protein